MNLEVIPALPPDFDETELFEMFHDRMQLSRTPKIINPCPIASGVELGDSFESVDRVIKFLDWTSDQHPGQPIVFDFKLEKPFP